MTRWHSQRAGGSLPTGNMVGGGPGSHPHRVLSLSAESASDTVPLQRSQSLPHSVTVALGGTSDPSALSSSALSEREASRLDKFKQLLAGPHTDLGESPARGGHMCLVLLVLRPQAPMCGLLCWRVVCVVPGSHEDGSCLSSKVTLECFGNGLPKQLIWHFSVLFFLTPLLNSFVFSEL